jgi:hypothetical protein
MIQDRDQKAKALAYVAARHWLPQLEVEIHPRQGTAASLAPITDIDVLGQLPDDFEGYRSIIIDCKTKKGESPMQRALWLRGLMHELGAPRGVCILKRDKIEPDHRYAASKFGVVLLTEDDLQQYIDVTTSSKTQPISMVGQIDLWDVFFQIPKSEPRLDSAITFLKSGFWQSENESAAYRKILAVLSEIAPELDPTKPKHLALACDFAALFMHAVARLVIKVFTAHLLPGTREGLSEAILLLLYGGREAYDYRNKLQKMVRAKGGDPATAPDLTPPHWDQFVQFVRQCLDSPFEANRSPLILKEKGWIYLAAEKGSDGFLKTLVAESPQGAKLAILGAEYLYRTAKLPPEFASRLTSDLLKAH